MLRPLGVQLTIDTIIIEKHLPRSQDSRNRHSVTSRDTLLFDLTANRTVSQCLKCMTDILVLGDVRNHITVEYKHTALFDVL